MDGFDAVRVSGVVSLLSTLGGLLEKRINNMVCSFFSREMHVADGMDGQERVGKMQEQKDETSPSTIMGRRGVRSD